MGGLPRRESRRTPTGVPQAEIRCRANHQYIDMPICQCINISICQYANICLLASAVARQNAKIRNWIPSPAYPHAASGMRNAGCGMRQAGGPHVSGRGQHSQYLYLDTDTDCADPGPTREGRLPAAFHIPHSASRMRHADTPGWGSNCGSWHFAAQLRWQVGIYWHIDILIY